MPSAPPSADVRVRPASAAPRILVRAAGWFRRRSKDEHAILAVATVLPIVLLETVEGAAANPAIVLLSLAYLVAQLGIGRIRGVRRARNWRTARYVAAAALVAMVMILDDAESSTLPVLFIPIVALAATMGSRPGGLVAAVSVGSYVLILGLDRGWMTVLDTALVPAIVVTFIAIGTRRVVASLERSLERARLAVAADRRRARRLIVIEEVGRILAQDGPSPAALGAIMDVLAGTFGYHHPSVYLWTGGILRLGAQRGYEEPIEDFSIETGIIGRVARNREAAFVPDVSADPDYVSADLAVVSEISVPLLSDGELLGVLNKIGRAHV